jgi:hypothetical protein
MVKQEQDTIKKEHLENRVLGEQSSQIKKRKKLSEDEKIQRIFIRLQNKHALATH